MFFRELYDNTTIIQAAEFPDISNKLSVHPVCISLSALVIKNCVCKAKQVCFFNVMKYFGIIHFCFRPIVYDF